MKDRLPAIIKVLEEISQESNGERAVEACGLLAQIDLKFVGLLVILIVNGCSGVPIQP